MGGFSEEVLLKIKYKYAKHGPTLY